VILHPLFCEDHLGRSEFAGACNANGLFVVGLVPAAVRDHQLSARLAPGIDHLLAIIRRIGHGLFRQDVFARLKSANCVFGMHSVWQNNVNDVYFGVVLNRIVVLVVVNVLGFTPYC